MVDFFEKNKAEVKDEIASLPRTGYLGKKRRTEVAFMVGLFGVLVFVAAGSLAVNPMGFKVNEIVRDSNASLEASDVKDSTATKEFILGDDDPKNALEVVLSPTANVDSSCLADRADIVDRDGNILASSLVKNDLEFHLDSYTFQNDAERYQLAREINRIIPAKKVDDIVRLLQRNTGYAHVAEGLSPSQVLELNSQIDTRYSGIMNVSVRGSRTYPKNELFAHALGSVRSDNCPIAGIEKLMNNAIVSGDGVVRLSLDEDIQYIVLSELLAAIKRTGAESAAAIIMDAQTGQVVARVSVPTYDLNQKSYLSNHEAQKFQILDKDTSLGAYEYGSVFKVFNTALALSRGENIYRVYETKKPLKVGGFNIPEPHPDKHNLDMVGIFLRSNNRGSALMALEAGHDAQAEFLERFGLIAPGQLDTVKTRGEASVATRAFGYGVEVTMSQLASATASLLNGGMQITPVYGYDEDGNTGHRIYDEYNSEVLRRMMLTNVTHARGTGTRAHRDGLLLGLKTGTSKIHVKGVGYSEDTRASVVGAFPMDKPRYVVVASLIKPKDEDGEPMNAGSATAPVVGNIAERIALSEGLLRSKAFAEQYETHHSLPYDHDPIKIARN